MGNNFKIQARWYYNGPARVLLRIAYGTDCADNGARRMLAL
jgi:hypothetical protein